MHDDDIQEWAEHIYSGTSQHSLTQHLTVEDIASWLDGEGNGDIEKVNDAVNQFMGTKTVEYYDNCARLAYAFSYQLGLDQDTICVGGVDITKRFD